MGLPKLQLQAQARARASCAPLPLCLCLCLCLSLGQSQRQIVRLVLRDAAPVARQRVPHEHVPGEGGGEEGGRGREGGG